MLKPLFKALFLFWPFLKSALFHDRPVREVLWENRQLTLTTVFILILVLFLYLTLGQLLETRSRLAALTETVETGPASALDVDVDEVEAAVEELKADLETCQLNNYDKSRVIRILQRQEN